MRLPAERVKVVLRDHLKALVAARGTLLLFTTLWASYAIVGIVVVLQWHIVETDAASRLAHAYFVWFNDPPKLAAIGFVWPPLMSIVFLPLALVKPLATSLLVLPLTSAFFGAALIVIVERTLKVLGLEALFRGALVAVLAFNPMIVYYSSNGMGETVYLSLIAAAVYAFIRWDHDQRAMWIVMMGFSLAFGVLTRYELFVWAAVFAVGVTAALVLRRASFRVLEASLLTLLSPVAYALALWVMLNWMIVDDPFFWVRSEVTQTFADAAAVSEQGWDDRASESLRRTLRLTWELFPAVPIVSIATLAAGVLLRDVTALLLGTLTALNAVSTAALSLLVNSEVLFEPRYNLRGVPVAIVALGWLAYRSRGRWRAAVVAAGAATFLLSYSSMWTTMRQSELYSLEPAFTRAVETLSSQEGVRFEAQGRTVGIEPEQEVVGWLKKRSTPNSVLVDDAKGFLIVLLSGRPDHFVDRTDGGDAAWNRLLERPRGRLNYVLVSKESVDLIRARYPEVLSGGSPFEPVFENERWLILKV